MEFPHARPRRWHEGHVVAVALSLIGAASAPLGMPLWEHPAVMHVIPSSLPLPLLMGAVGVTMGAVGWWAASKPSMLGLLRALGGGAVGGVVSLALVGLLEGLGAGGVVGGLAGMVMGLVNGLLTGAPLGAAFGLVASLPIWAAAWHRHDVSHEGVDATLQVTGAWLLVVGGALSRIGPTRGAWVGGVAALVGVAAWGVGAWGARRRRRFVARVRAGEEDGWSLEPLTGEPGAGVWPVLERRDLRSRMFALVPQDARRSEYRSAGGERTAVALIEEDARS